MQDVLRQLGAIPGVIGALACGPHGELLASAFPPLFDELALHQVAGLFSDETAGLRRLAGPGGVLDVRYARGRALAKPFAQGTVLLLATHAADVQLLGISLEQAARRLDGAPRPTAPAAHAPGAAAPTAVPAEVAAAREPLQELLVSHIGPVGELVLAEAWAAWTAAGPPTRERLARLVDDLAREVDDEGDRGRFVAAARALC